MATTPARMSRATSLAVLAILLSCARPSASAPVAVQQALLIMNASLVDVQAGVIRPRSSVLVRGDTIVRISAGDVARVSPSLRVIDARERYLIPGLIDTHVHLFQPWNFNWPDSISQLGWILASGVTTVRDASGGGILEPTYVALREAIRGGIVQGPRIVVSAQVPRPLPETREALLDELRSFLVRGFDQVKLIGNLSAAEAERVIHASKSVGLTVYGHTSWWPNDSTVEEFAGSAVDAGLDGLSHSSGRYDGGRRVDQGLRGWLDPDTAWQAEVIAKAVRAGAWLEPTLTVTYAGNRLVYGHCTSGCDEARVRRYYPFHSAPRPQNLTPAQRDTVATICSAHWTFVQAFHEAGGLVVAGSDFVPFYPLGVVEEARLLNVAGLSPTDALRAATMNAAKSVGLENEVGRIVPGFRADMVLLDGNPLEDITALGRVAIVIAAGRVIDIDELWRRWGTDPPIVLAQERRNVIDPALLEIIAANPEASVEVLVMTNELLLPGDPAGIQRFLGLTLVEHSGSRILLRGSAARVPALTRLRFVEGVVLSREAA
ncbi:amidohydrolase family protein [soil metagenome]